MSESNTRRSSSWLDPTRGSVLLAPAAALVVPAFIFYGVLANDIVFGDMGDARFTNYILEHVYRWAIGDS